MFTVWYRENNAVLERCENISILEPWSTNAVSITGDLITVDLARDVTTLIVGDPQVCGGTTKLQATPSREARR